MNTATQQQLFANLEILHQQLEEVAVRMERDRHEAGLPGETGVSRSTTEKLG